MYFWFMLDLYLAKFRNIFLTMGCVSPPWKYQSFIIFRDVSQGHRCFSQVSDDTFSHRNWFCLFRQPYDRCNFLFQTSGRSNRTPVRRKNWRGKRLYFICGGTVNRGLNMQRWLLRQFAESAIKKKRICLRKPSLGCWLKGFSLLSCESRRPNLGCVMRLNLKVPRGHWLLQNQASVTSPLWRHTLEQFPLFCGTCRLFYTWLNR